MPVDFKDYYQTLGVARDATEADIKKAFRKLARQHHPDLAKDKVAAEEKFKEINEAYEVLSDSDKRKRYDQLGSRWKDGGGFQPPPGNGGGRSQEFHFGGTGFSDFFEQFFGGGAKRGGGGFDNVFRGAGGAGGMGGGAHGFMARGEDIEGDILVTLTEVMEGSSRVVSLQRVNRTTGKTEKDTIKVKIPPGVQDGQSIRVRGKGDEGRGGGEPGDLYLRVKLAAHPDFTPKGADLYCDLDIAPWEGVLGASVSVPAPGGGQVKLRIPAGTNHGQKFRVRGQGLPKGVTGERGDLYAVVNVELPSKLTDEERALWEKLATTSAFKPRND